MTAQRIPVAGPWITQREIDYVADAVANSWYGAAGNYTTRFENAFAAQVARGHAVSLPSCTSGLHLLLAALNIGPGDEVVVPDITWIATSAPISYVGATPVFADVDSRTWCIDPGSLPQVLSSKTKAVIAVDLYGGMADFDALERVTVPRGIPLIEDAAEAIGSEWRSRPAGSFGTASVFSLHGSKTVTTGEGGMLVTDSEEILERVMVLRDHGRLLGDRQFRNAEVGFKYKMSDLQAALGLAQIERCDEIVQRKRAIFDRYAQALDGRVILNAEPPGTRNSYWMVTAIVPEVCPLRTPEIMEALGVAGIDSRPFFHPLSSLPAYEGTQAARDGRDRNAVSYSLSPRGINLPSALSLTEAEIDQVVTTFLEIIEGPAPDE